MRQKSLRKAVLVGLLGLVLCLALAVAGLYAALHSPYLLNKLAHAFGYDVAARTVALSPFGASVSDLTVRSLGDGQIVLTAARVTAKSSLEMVLRGEVDSLVLRSPKLTFRMDKPQGGETDLSVLRSLPNVRLLDIQDAEVLVALPDEGQLRISRANLTVRNFSSAGGGDVAFRGSFAVTTPGSAVAAQGRVSAALKLTGAYPRPYGTGTVDLALDSGSYTSEGRKIALGALTLAANLAYDRPTEMVRIASLRGESKDLGAIEGTAQAVLRGDTPWQAKLSVGSMEFAQVFGLLKPFLPAEYHAWTLQGKGAVETDVQGTYANQQPAFRGTVAFSFDKGGFSSPDSTKAAESVSGKIVLKLQYAPSDRLAFDLHWDGSGGEYLWGKYYTNMAGQKASLVADGTFFLAGDRPSEVRGTLDFFQTGEYRFSGDARANNWTLRLHADQVSHPRVLDTLLKAYFKELSPRLATLSFTGTSSLDAVVRKQDDTISASGTYRMADASLNAPDLSLAIQEAAIHLPFSLSYPMAEEAAPVAGSIEFKGIQRKRLSIENLQIPVTIARNGLEVPAPVVVPFFGGSIHLYGLQINDVLFPTRYHFGVKVEGVDLGRMTRVLAGSEYPGTINADLGSMTYENNRIASEGRAVIRVFGGEVDATNFFAENLASPGRRFGGDVTFENINLEELTKKIAIGKMTGLIRGSLKNFVMEYGQPASFALEVESVAKWGIPRRISTDAIQNISILGTGVANPLNQGLLRFFREYPYSKIGFRCVLNNDVFSIRGTIHEDDKEYLVRRGLLRGVDVVNQNPDNAISFRDMEERLARIARPPEAEPPQVETR